METIGRVQGLGAGVRIFRRLGASVQKFVGVEVLFGRFRVYICRFLEQSYPCVKFSSFRRLYAVWC